LEALKNTLASKQIKVLVATLDVRNAEDIHNWIEGLEDKVKNNLSILVNNAGLAVGRSGFQDGLIEDWERMIDTNFKGLMYMSREIIPYLTKNENAIIVNITSIAGKEAYPSGNVYCATKAAVDHLSKAIRMDLVHAKVRVSTIAPGAADTEFSLVRFKGNEAVAKQVYQGFDPLQAEDIAEAVRFIITRPSHVSIHDLVIMPTAQASATLFNKD
jgi:NADP-dependent 3-hydroxy acid dehydrogenase YdfG